MRRAPRRSGLKVFVAENFGAIHCAECGRVLLKSDLESIWRFHWSPPRCLDCLDLPIGRDTGIATEFEGLKLY
jgi:hypothetical protein